MQAIVSLTNCLVVCVKRPLLLTNPTSHAKKRKKNEEGGLEGRGGEGDKNADGKEEGGEGQSYLAAQRSR